VHHSQIDRSANLYATTQLYARIIERLDRVQGGEIPTDVPKWALATMLMDEGFDEWNSELTEKFKQDSKSIQRFQTIPNLQAREMRSLVGVRSCISYMSVASCRYHQPTEFVYCWWRRMSRAMLQLVLEEPASVAPLAFHTL
jgi:hypothetical protein